MPAQLSHVTIVLGYANCNLQDFFTAVFSNRTLASQVRDQFLTWTVWHKNPAITAFFHQCPTLGNCTIPIFACVFEVSQVQVSIELM